MAGLKSSRKYVFKLRLNEVSDGEMQIFKPRPHWRL